MPVPSDKTSLAEHVTTDKPASFEWGISSRTHSYKQRAFSTSSVIFQLISFAFS
jgi:hypothetical protein